MTGDRIVDRTHESIINDALARVLRERAGLDAAAETLRERARPDIMVRLSESVVVLELEVEPAPTVEADALSRLGMEIDGLRVQNVFAVKAPEQLRSTSQHYLYERMGAATLEWQEWRFDGTSGPMLKGSALELADAVARTVPPIGNLDAAVDALDDGVRRAGARLFRSPGTIKRISEIFNTEPSDEVANMAALLIINAMVFQERLASGDGTIQSISAARRNGIVSLPMLLQIWDEILEIDYKPIFEMARDVASEMTEIESGDVLGECADTAGKMLGMQVVGRHDLAGRIFNRLIADRKLLAAFYTSIPASTLLAGLALSPDRWGDVDWSDVSALENLRVVDPACGTGTLLMAAYRQIVQNHATSSSATPEDEALHKALVENVLFGADVVQAAIHLTAATLAAMSPTVSFRQMELHTLHIGLDSKDTVWLGSLDWLQASDTQSFFSATQEQITAITADEEGAKSGTGRTVNRPRADLVISNPPYTRRGSDGGKSDAIERLFSVPEGDKKSMDAVKRRTGELLRGTPANQIGGHGTSFAVLADRMVNPGGRIAFVLPVTALTGESWRQVRQMWASRYEMEFVIASHDPKLRSMSFDTGIAETLLVARRLRNGESASGRGRFVNLWRAPYQETDALAIAKALNAASAHPSLRADGPPAGGSPLIIGGEQWGEIIDGHVDDGPWKASLWKNGATGQFAAALERGELWTADGLSIAANIPVSTVSDVCNVGPQHRRIRGSLGAFDGYHGWNEQAQFPALWAHSESVHQGMETEPNAWLTPQPGKDYAQIWGQSGRLQVTCDVRYNSQRVMGVLTPVRTLGMSTWHTLMFRDDNRRINAQCEILLALWCNSTMGMFLHANHANRTQQGRGRGNKGMLETLTTLDVRELQPWQLEEAQALWRDFRGRKFDSFHRCAVDAARIELDERLVRDVLGLGDDAVAAVSRLRTLLASEPSIHGSKVAELPR